MKRKISFNFNFNKNYNGFPQNLIDVFLMLFFTIKNFKLFDMLTKKGLRYEKSKEILA